MPEAKHKNLMGKSRDVDHPYLVFEAPGWTWKVLKSWQGDDTKPYARWFCAVEGPGTFGGYDLGDTYVVDVVQYGRLTWADPEVFAVGGPEVNYVLRLAQAARRGEF